MDLDSIKTEVGGTPTKNTLLDKNGIISLTFWRPYCRKTTN